MDLLKLVGASNILAAGGVGSSGPLFDAELVIAALYQSSSVLCSVLWPLVLPTFPSFLSLEVSLLDPGQGISLLQGFMTLHKDRITYLVLKST